jgi:signal transduction histidine kinase
MSWPTDRLEELERRKNLLTARAAAQRAAIAGTLHEWRRPLTAADHVSRALRLLREHPLLSAVAAAALVALPRGRLVSLAWRGITLWRLLETVAGILAERRDRQGSAPR